MHTLTTNFAADLTAYINAVLDANGNERLLNGIYKELTNVLHKNFNTDILEITPGCSCCGTSYLENAYKDFLKAIEPKWLEANKYHYHIEDSLFRAALNKLTYSASFDICSKVPEEIRIYTSEPCAIPDAYYVTSWRGKADYGLYVIIKQRFTGRETRYDLTTYIEEVKEERKEREEREKAMAARRNRPRRPRIRG